MSIKRELLIHKVQYYPYVKDDGWEQPTIDPIDVKRVRVEPADTLYVDNAGVQKKARSRLFWDSVWSTYCNFKIQGKIKFEDQEMTIVEVQKHYDRSKLHHVELLLI